MMLTRSQAAADGREERYGYDAVGNRTWMVDGTRAPATRWAVSAVASSSYYAGTGLGTPAQAAGAPDIAGCNGGTMAPHWSAGFDSWTVARQEWLEVTYAQAERAVGVRVHETSYAPFVNRIDLVEEVKSPSVCKSDSR